MKFKNLILGILLLVTAGIFFFWACQEAVPINAGSGKAALCTPTAVISAVPYSFDGAGEYCWETTSIGAFINSWSLDIFEINGTSYLNTYTASSTIPILNGKYVIHYKSSVNWGHFEIQGNGGSTAVPTSTSGTVATRTPTTVATMTATGVSRTATQTTISRTATATRTATTRTATATRTATSAATRTSTRTATATSVPTRTITATTGPSATPGTIQTGNSTYFYNLGGPYGGCGLNQADLDTQNFVALNVQNTPYDYTTFYRRPFSAEDAPYLGFFNNGLNCGRWVRVTIGDFCNGTNDGAMYLPFCRDGTGWTSDAYNGATLDMIVADSCQDGNAWCRDDPNHLDLAFASLNLFVKNGLPVGDMFPDHYNNRQISWSFIEAPNYTGDIKIGFILSAQIWWPAVAINHLQNGIHGVDCFDGTNWVKATMNGDLGQSYILIPTAITNGVPASTYRIRVYDASDKLINNGRVYNFSYPASCETSCLPTFTEVTYTIE